MIFEKPRRKRLGFFVWIGCCFRLGLRTEIYTDLPLHISKWQKVVLLYHEGEIQTILRSYPDCTIERMSSSF